MTASEIHDPSNGITLQDQVRRQLGRFRLAFVATVGPPPSLSLFLSLFNSFFPP